ncbi:hypothetical protein NDU88_005714 [Pleurodeles waltl]|uniref:Uncharacterized protein n=1 Tax=Pleurodeles waltl TaxID=8319 RepID=A0AAV7PG70_PLEWA|nr:hypothetical protein NDU88_005714 [Pleurodeles waltl]
MSRVAIAKPCKQQFVQYDLLEGNNNKYWWLECDIDGNKDSRVIGELGARGCQEGVQTRINMGEFECNVNEREQNKNVACGEVKKSCFGRVLRKPKIASGQPLSLDRTPQIEKPQPLNKKKSVLPKPDKKEIHLPELPSSTVQPREPSEIEGPEGLCIYNQLQKHDRGNEDVFHSAILDLDRFNEDEFHSAISDLNDNCSPAVCIVVTCHTFFQRMQDKDEDIETYVSALKHLASSCRFAGLHYELVRDQIVMYTKNKSIQERLWIEGKSSLKDIIALVKKAELSERCAKITLAEDKKSEEIIAKVNDWKHKKVSMDKRDNYFTQEKNYTFA